MPFRSPKWDAFKSYAEDRGEPLREPRECVCASSQAVGAVDTLLLGPGGFELFRRVQTTDWQTQGRPCFCCGKHSV